MSQVRAIRGATQLEANTASAMESATKELLLEILEANELTPEDLISVFLTVTPDLNAAFPAAFARDDPYVQNGIVMTYSIRPWTTVVGRAATTPVHPAV